MPLRTNVDKALHQVRRGRRTVRARDFNQDVRDLPCACVGTDCAVRGCWSLRQFRKGLPYDPLEYGRQNGKARILELARGLGWRG